MKASDIYCAASIAALAALPKESRDLIDRRDAIEQEWRARCRAANSWSLPAPQELFLAGEAIENDPLAAAAIQIRRMVNRAWAAEYDAEKQPVKP